MANMETSIKHKNLCIVAIVFLSIFMSFMEISLNVQGKEVSDQSQLTWDFVFLVLTIIWAWNDTKQSNVPHTTFDFGIWFYIFWPIMFPWYLIKTRGFEGLLMLLGFLFLWLGPWFFGYVAYVHYA
tara:strand:+ start:328 stop:705 length:378 start_codon:yes stop_codon:yes gene_type:complete